MGRKLTIILFASMLLLSSCDDWLELIPPDGLVKDEYWQSEKDVEAVLMGAYQKFAQLDDKLFIFGEIRADMVSEDTNTPSSQRNIIQGNIYPDNELCDWSDFYEVINYCNFVYKYAPIVQKLDQTFSPYEMQSYQAEAIFLRSMAYFYLVRIFKEVPLVLEPSEDDDVDFFLPKSSDSTILRTIKNDLIEARSFTRDNYGSLADNKGRATKGAINALLADICLWNFEYQECIEHINLAEQQGYELLPAGKWFTNYYPGNSLESIFEFQFDASLNQNSSMYNFTYWQRYYLASDYTIEVLLPEVSLEIIRGNGSLRSYDFKIWKYCGAMLDGKTLRPSADIYSTNWIIYRYADLLLMKAEALSQLERYDEAQALINRVRNRSLMDSWTTPQTRDAFEDAILVERAKELAFEGKRWFDLLRMARRNNFQRKNKLIEIIVEKVPASQKVVLSSKLTDPYSWYLPIQDEELERNKNLVQNPFYAIYSEDD